MIKDLSDEGLVRVFGDAMHEMPELYDAIRLFEMQNRPAVTSGGFKMNGDWVSVERGADMLRMKIGNARSME